ncbi:chorismate synthase [Cetobacterium sp. SF1]|uniref:chorismate synthase n=1 Tax=Cetobacterium sp. SF1 TaxID=3417654 RepID=UPI003CF2C08E
MNTFGTLLRVSIYGESHGEGVGVLIDGLPPGIALDIEDLMADIIKRKPGGVGTTKRVESDIPHILSGLYEGYTSGAPMNIFFKNENKNSRVYMDFKSHPRPGHADYTSTIKYRGYNDLRGGGHFSGRLTLGLVAAGAVAKKILGSVEIKAQLKTLGNLEVNENIAEIEDYLQEVTLQGDSVGGIIQCVVKNLPQGLGEPFFQSVESKLASILFSVPGLKGVEFGAGFLGTTLKGSEYNDNFIDRKGKTESNNNGGINGGITNGNPVVFRVAIKPTASIFMAQDTFNFQENKIMPLEISGRHDAAFVVRVPVVIEAVTAIALADLYLQNLK